MDHSHDGLAAPPATDDTQSTGPDERGQPTSLSRERIIGGAIVLLDAEGLPGLSMRRLADNLNAGAMSLYWYFSTKDELIKATTDAVLGEIRLQNLPDDWRAAVRQIASDLRAVIHRHAWLGQTLSGSPAVGPHGIAVVETLLLTLSRAGLAVRQLDFAATTIFGYMLGFAVGEHLWVRTFRDDMGGALMLPPEVVADRPFLASFVADAAKVDPDLRFIAGVNLLLAGIEAGALG